MNAKFRRFLVREGFISEGDRWEDPQAARELMRQLQQAAQRDPSLAYLVDLARNVVPHPPPPPSEPPKKR